MTMRSTDARQSVAPHTMPAYLPMMVLLAFTAFLLTGFGNALGALQPIPVYLFLCLALLTIQEHIAENRAFAHRLYVFLASTFAVIYASEVYFQVKQLNFTRSPLTYVLLEATLLAVFLADIVSRHRRIGAPATSSAHFGRWAIDAAATAVFFYVSAFLVDLLGNQIVLQPFGVRIGTPYVMVDLNALFHLHLSSPANTLDGLNLVLGLGATALALGLLTMAGVVLPSAAEDPEHADGLRSYWQIMREGVAQVVATLRLVIGPLIWLIPAFSVAAFSDHVTQYFNACARQQSTVFDLFNPFSATSRENVPLGVTTLLLGLVAVSALVVAVAAMEENTAVIRHTLATLRDVARAIALTWALFMYSLAAINAVAILLSVTKAAPFQVGAPGLLALLIGAGFLVVESAQIAKTEGTTETAPRAQPSHLERTAPLIERPPRQIPRTPANLRG